MGTRNLLIGVIIGLLVGALGGYVLFNKPMPEENTLFENQVTVLTQQVSDLTQQVTDLTQQLTSKEETVLILEERLRQKGTLVSDLRLLIESLQEVSEEEPLNPLPDQEYVNRTWVSSDIMNYMHYVYTDNITLNGNPLAFSWTRSNEVETNVNIVIYDAETDYDYRSYTVEDVDSPYVTEAIPEGIYYVSVKSSQPFTFTIQETQ